MGARIRKCGRCAPPVVRRADGSRITGFLPMAEFVGFLIVPRHLRVQRLPRQCPNCGTQMVETASAGLREEGIVWGDE